MMYPSEVFNGNRYLLGRKNIYILIITRGVADELCFRLLIIPLLGILIPESFFWFFITICLAIEVSNVAECSVVLLLRPKFKLTFLRKNIQNTRAWRWAKDATSSSCATTSITFRVVVIIVG